MTVANLQKWRPEWILAKIDVHPHQPRANRTPRSGCFSRPQVCRHGHRNRKTPPKALPAARLPLLSSSSPRRPIAGCNQVEVKIRVQRERTVPPRHVGDSRDRDSFADQCVDRARIQSVTTRVPKNRQDNTWSANESSISAVTDMPGGTVLSPAREFSLQTWFILRLAARGRRRRRRGKRAPGVPWRSCDFGDRAGKLAVAKSIHFEACVLPEAIGEVTSISPYPLGSILEIGTVMNFRSAIRAVPTRARRLTAEPADRPLIGEK